MKKLDLIKAFKNMGAITRYIIVAVAAIVLVAILALVIFLPKGETTVSVESSLKEVLAISDLSTAEYTYNSIAEVKNDNGETKYHAAYKGNVKVGVDFENIQFVETDKEIKIVIPSLKIQSVEVYTDIDLIFTKDKYNTETIYAEAYNKCIDDLTQKARSNKSLMDIARESAVDVVTGLLRPLESQLAEGKSFIVAFADEQE